MEKSRSRTEKDAKVSTKGEYERSHPALSVRLTEGEMGKLKSIAEKSGRKVTDLVKAGAGIGAAMTDRAYKEGLKKGFSEGFEKAKQKYVVYTMCAACLKQIPITDGEMSGEAGDLYFNNYTCLHEGCQLPKNEMGDEVRRFNKEE